MISLWSDKDLKLLKIDLKAKGFSNDLIERVYTTRLLGKDSKLVLHGGGNTSLKTQEKDIVGEIHDVLRVKGSGWDMAKIEPIGLPSVKLLPLLKLKYINSITDQEMVNYIRANLLNVNSPNPSVEALLHAFLPYKYIDHTHASAILTVTNQKNGIEICNEILGETTGIVPYVMPGFDLAKNAYKIYEQNKKISSLILVKHGIFTFADNARESYENMIYIINKFEDYINSNRNKFFVNDVTPNEYLPIPEIASIIRGACTERDGSGFDELSRFILSFRSNKKILDYVNDKEILRYSQLGVVTPDHIIRTKHVPVVLNAPILIDKTKFKEHTYTVIKKFVEEYRNYFSRNNKRYDFAKTELDPLPRVVLVKGVGLFGLGKSLEEANIVADLAENTIEVITDSESIGQFESISESDLFDVEYWSLEQAKIKKPKKILEGNVVVITGSVGAIGSATYKLFKNYGAEVVLLDYNLKKINELQKSVKELCVHCDVTNKNSVAKAFKKICEIYGGIDILISNAGTAIGGSIAEVDDKILRKSFEENFFSHQNCASEAIKIMKKQNIDGCLLFNISKQSVNPGKNFGPYGLPKSALLSLCKQYALDYGNYGIRSNGVNADRIRSGLLNDKMIKSRAKAREVSEDQYMKGNLLLNEVKAEDVAKAFFHLAVSKKTTGAVLTVDGGNIAASLR